MASPMALRSYKSFGPEAQGQSSGGFIKGLNIQYVVQLTEVGEGLMAKMYRLHQILDQPDPASYVFSESFWKSGVFPNFPKICTLVAKKFPEHTSKLQLERVRFGQLVLCCAHLILQVLSLVLIWIDSRAG